MRSRQPLTEKDEALFGPIGMKEPGSREWCWQIVYCLQSLWRTFSRYDQDFKQTLEQIEQHRAWEQIPPDKPYGSLDALLRAELGVGEYDVHEAIAARNEERRKQAALSTTGEVLPSDGSVNPGNASKFCGHSQTARAEKNGISHYTQRKLDKLARQRPDLLERVRTGELSATAACIEAGWEVRHISVPLDADRAAYAILRNFEEKDIVRMIALLGDALDVLEEDRKGEE